MSRFWAIEHGNEFIGVEHLLLGVIAEDKNPALVVFNRLAVNTKQLIHYFKTSVRTSGRKVDTGASLPLTKQAEIVVRESLSEAKKLNNKIVEPEHFILAILNTSDSPVTSILSKTGINYLTFLQELKEYYSDQKSLNLHTEIINLKVQIDKVRLEKNTLVKFQELEKAAGLRDLENRLMNQIDVLEEELYSTHPL